MARVTIDGGKALDRKLRQLEPQLARKIVRTSLRKAMKPTQVEAKRLAPTKTGKLRAAIKLRAMKRSRSRYGILVTLNAGNFQGKTFYGAFLEWGTKQGKRERRKDWVDERPKRIAAMHFLRRAAENKKDEAVAILTAEIKKGIAEATRLCLKTGLFVGAG